MAEPATSAKNQSVIVTPACPVGMFGVCPTTFRPFFRSRSKPALLSASPRSGLDAIKCRIKVSEESGPLTLQEGNLRYSWDSPNSLSSLPHPTSIDWRGCFACGLFEPWSELIQTKSTCSIA